MRSLHIDHGNPMNALLDTPFTKCMKELWRIIKKPENIIILSAHSINETAILEINSNPTPPMIYDMYGFPNELYRVEYPVNNDIRLGITLSEVLWNNWIQNRFTPNQWIDHGIWSVLIHLFPEGNIPIVPISLQYHEPTLYHFELGKILASNFSDDTLFISSGNIVHNLRLLDWESSITPHWAHDFDIWIATLIQTGTYDSILNYQSIAWASESVPIPDHFYPFVTCLGSSEGKLMESVCQWFELGSISTRIYKNF